MKSNTHIKLLVVVGWMILTNVLYSCPNCKDGYSAGSQQAMIGESYSYSVVFFLGMLMSLLFSGTAFISWKMKRTQKEREEMQRSETQ